MASRINGDEVVDSYDVYTVRGEVAGQPVGVVVDGGLPEALQVHGQMTGSKITWATHYVTEEHEFTMGSADEEMTPVG